LITWIIIIKNIIIIIIIIIILIGSINTTHVFSFDVYNPGYLFFCRGATMSFVHL
jgi:hypothetical protein